VSGSAGSPIINNNAIAARAINPVTYQGGRVAARWDFADDWSALITQSYQDMDARGVFYQMPKSSDGVALPKQSVTLFNNSYNKDRFENTALTINGRIGVLRAVYAGSYWCATSTRCRTTPITRAVCMRTITSATQPTQRTASLQPASRRAAFGTRRSAMRIRVMSSG